MGGTRATAMKVEFTRETVLFIWPVRRREISYADITGYYLSPFLPGESSLVVAYHEDGRRRDLDAVLPVPLAESVLAKFQEFAPAAANLQGHDKKTAMKLLGRRDPARIAFAATVLLALFLALVIQAPNLWHGLAHRQLRQISLVEGAEAIGAMGGYLQVEAVAGPQMLVLRERANLGMTRRNVGYVPLLPGDWRNGEQAVVVLVVAAPYVEEVQNNLGRIRQWQGITRNLLWEGVPQSRLDELAALNSMRIDDPLLLEYRGSPAKDLLIASVTIASSVLLTVIAGVGLWRSRRRREKG